MASAREMHAVASDPARVHTLAIGLIALGSKQRQEMKFSARHSEALLALRDFRLTSRQIEKLLEIRDATVLHRDVAGISVSKLIVRCYEARIDLDEGDDEFIERLWKKHVHELRSGDLARLKRCSIQLGELEPYM
jgi:hypothetical protein